MSFNSGQLVLCIFSPHRSLIVLTCLQCVYMHQSDGMTAVTHVTRLSSIFTINMMVYDPSLTCISWDVIRMSNAVVSLVGATGVQA